LVSSSFSAADGNVIYLADNNEDITGADDANIVDLVGFGAAVIFEGAAAAPSVAEEHSIARVPAGEDDNENSSDFVLSEPTPQGAGGSGENGIGGTVLLTVMPALTPVRNITSAGAEIVFQVNGASIARVNFGPDASYGQTSTSAPAAANAETAIALSGLECGATYHYSIYAENLAGTENDSSADASFETLPCGIRLDSLTMTKTGAKAKNSYADGWRWEFRITVWDEAETTLKMKFNSWSGLSALPSGGNMRFSADGTNWRGIDSDNAYPALGVDLAGLDQNPAEPGRQILVRVEMKVPAGTLVGDYDSNWGILTE
jgi:hypothetical protein